jgi:hypothetical protein
MNKSIQGDFYTKKETQLALFEMNSLAQSGCKAVGKLLTIYFRNNQLKSLFGFNTRKLQFGK